jgi:DNA modification methylase
LGVFCEKFPFIAQNLSNSRIKGLMSYSIVKHILGGTQRYGVIHASVFDALSDFPDECIDCVITSPPYWQLREYAVTADSVHLVVGQENTIGEYVQKLSDLFKTIWRVLKPSGSLWLNLGDTYQDKNLVGVPWRVALALQDSGWILRNDVIWEKMKGTQPVKDRLRNNHEHIFHFVKQSKYYYATDEIRVKPRLMPISTDENTISATGVSGKKYRQQIMQSTILSTQERDNALLALEEVLSQIRAGEVIDFRMTIRGEQRTLHGNGQKTSGRARELEQRGFFIMKSYAKGFVPSDVWRLAPEDTVKNRQDDHYAVFPMELLRIPILATCPIDGVILDPFVGTGSTLFAAMRYERRAIGIDISREYTQQIQKTLERYLL